MIERYIAPRRRAHRGLTVIPCRPCLATAAAVGLLQGQNETKHAADIVHARHRYIAQPCHHSQIGHRLHVFAFGVADLVQPTVGVIDFDMRWKAAPSGGHRDNDDQASGTSVHLVVRNNDCWAKSALLTANRFAEVDEPDVPTSRPQAGLSRRVAASTPRSASILRHVSGSLRSSAKRLLKASKNRRRSSASSASSTTAVIGRPDARARAARRPWVLSLTRIVVLTPPVYIPVAKCVYRRFFVLAEQDVRLIENGRDYR